MKLYMYIDRYTYVYMELSLFYHEKVTFAICPVSKTTYNIAMETAIMYMTMWGVEVDMDEKGVTL